MNQENRPSAEFVLETVERAGIGHARTDRDGIILYMSPAFSRKGTLVPDPPPKKPWYTLDHAAPARHDMRAQVWRHFIERAQPWQGIVQWHLSPKEVNFFEGTASYADDGTVILVMNDRTSKVQADKRVEDMIALYSQILRDLPVALAVTDLDGKVTYMNEFLPRRLNRPASSFYGKTLTQSFGNHLTEVAEEVINRFPKDGSEPEGLTLTLKQEAGTGTWLAYAQPLLDAKGERVATLNLAIDRTERTRLREEHTRLTEAMYEAQNISALNDFAGNLAHELSNILHPVAFYARKLSNVAKKDTCTEYAAKINKGVMAAGDILRRTMSLTGRDSDSAEPCDLKAILTETLSSARDLAPPGLIYKEHLPEEPVWAEVGRTGFRQVLLNLLNNAAQAMNYLGTVTITLELRDEDIPDGIARAETGQAICLCIEDEGPGIDPDMIERIFEAFVTTKSAGRGVGLGLSVVKGLVTGWGGTVTAACRPGGGAAFSVWIPGPSME